MKSTDPKGWSSDVRPPLKSFSDIIIYEMHHRDFSADTISGIRNNGKFLALTEEGTHTYLGEATGIAHLKELGITHVQLLPSFDFSSVDETRKIDLSTIGVTTLKTIMCPTGLTLQILILPKSA